MKMKKSVVNFFTKYYHPDLFLLHEYQKYSVNVDTVSKVLTVDWLFYNFIQTDYRCTDILRSVYHWVITSPEYYWDKRPDDYLLCIHNLKVSFTRQIFSKKMSISNFPIIMRMNFYQNWKGLRTSWIRFKIILTILFLNNQ